MSDDGDDCPPRPRRRIKRVVVMSSSDSDGDGDVCVAESRRKRLRILSDDDADESSGSSVVRAGTRRRRTLPKLKDSETESDSSGWASDRSNAPGPAASTSKTTSGFTSDSSEGNTDKCSICLLRFRNQEVGTPESCEHIFCLDCITEWSKNVNTCPVDRTVFNSIVVRACAGGRVLRTQPVKVVERRPSVEMFVIEDLTVCEVCGRTDGEESMLLCDGCDLGYHMQCLSPPLTQVPPDQWLCPNCPADALDDDDMLQNINLSEVEDILDEFLDSTPPTGPRPSALRRQRNVRRSSRSFNTSDQPSTSSGRRSDSFNSIEEPTTSRGSGGAPRSTSLAAAAPRRRTTTRRKYKRRRTKTVVIEYEVQENGKFPITKKVTRKVKKRRVRKRQPRTAARTRAGVRPLSLLGNPNELDYFSDDADAVSEEASTAVSLRPSANIFSAYRQARRKMLAVPSPPHAASAPDLLSDILESQTLLHSKNSVVSISVDGNVNIKLQNERRPKKATDLKREEKIDLSKATADAKEAPAYPGQNRGGGGWGGGYRGNYHREQTSNFNRGGNYDGSYGGGYQQRPGSNSYDHQSNNNGTGSNMRREEPDYYDTFPRRPQQPQQYSHDEPHFDRSRRPAPEGARPAGGLFANHHSQRPADQTHSRYSLNPAWPPYGQRQDAPPAQARHSFGGFENPLDMRMGQVPPTGVTADSFSRVEAPRQEKAQPPSYQSLPEPQAFQPLAEPPVFNFPKISEVDKSEDEKSDPGLVIDTEKYDPTEPTHDDDSGEDDAEAAEAAELAPPALAPPPSPPPMVHSILASMDPAAMNVPSNILDTAVRQVLKEHRNLIVSPTVETLSRSDDESDGDCPNFSIYSAASVHIANNSSTLTEEAPPERVDNNLEDLVQEDDDTPPSTSPVVVRDGEPKLASASTPAKPYYSNSEYDEKKKSEEEYKEKVSKRCPITTSKRNPIKIKLNTPSLIKRQVSLYDEEDVSPEAEAAEADLRADPPDEDKKIAADKTPAVEILEKTKSDSTPKETDKECGERLQSPIDKQSNKDKNDDSVNDKDSPHTAASQEERDASPDSANRKRDGRDELLNCDEEEENNNDSSENDQPRHADVTRDPDDADADVSSERELLFSEQSPKAARDPEKLDDNVEKMTESISETEDERSYTPCLDENKSTKDASFEDKGLEGLDTEMISEDEGNEMFSEHERGSPAVSAAASPAASRATSRAASRAASPARDEDGEIPDKKEGKKSADGGKKKKKKESKREGKEKAKGKKRSDIAFKKLSKSGKERNYRERDKDDKKERERRHSTDAERQRRRKEKRKDLERYDVRTLVSEKRRKQKDPFGRDVSPRARSP